MQYCKKINICLIIINEDILPVVIVLYCKIQIIILYNTIILQNNFFIFNSNNNTLRNMTNIQ